MERAKLEQIEQENQRRAWLRQQQQLVSKASTPQPPTPSLGSSSQPSYQKDLDVLKRLYDAGFITAQEYRQRQLALEDRSKQLGRLPSQPLQSATEEEDIWGLVADLENLSSVSSTQQDKVVKQVRQESEAPQNFQYMQEMKANQSDLQQEQKLEEMTRKKSSMGMPQQPTRNPDSFPTSATPKSKLSGAIRVLPAGADTVATSNQNMPDNLDDYFDDLNALLEDDDSTLLAAAVVSSESTDSMSKELKTTNAKSSTVTCQRVSTDRASPTRNTAQLNSLQQAPRPESSSIVLPDVCLDPSSPNFDVEAYKNYMRLKYAKEQEENARLLQARRESK